MRVANEGIMYPKDAKSALLPYFEALKPSQETLVQDAPAHVIEIPHAAWTKCKDALDKAFSTLKGLKPSCVFVLGPLHKGPVSYEDPALVYAPCDGSLKGTDWEISLETPSSLHPYVRFSDDICSEEHSLEVAAPYLSLFFENAPVCYLLASGSGEDVKKIAAVIKKDFPKALVFISNNIESCCGMFWKEALNDGYRT
ncbi:MAG: AmmeMemoRadiSam system protein B [Spirochaetales bacterium]|nr:AmmeMemoRadiSam system protein B [Spirochaetales bacterium]